MENLNDDPDLFNQLLFLQMMMDHQDGESSRRGQTRPLHSPAFIRASYNHAKIQQEKQAKYSVLQVKNTVSNKVYVSKEPLKNLERTDIGHLLLETAAKGKYVLLRVLEGGYRVVGWHTVVEDHAGNVCNFSVYNYACAELFPVGTFLIVKEPYFKIAGDGFQYIRCDCPTDIIVLRSSHKLYSTASNVKWKQQIDKRIIDLFHELSTPFDADEWKQRGNLLFDRQQLPLAREAYLKGLNTCKEDHPTFKLLQLNLVAVNLELTYYELAIQIAKQILDKHPAEAKALFRAGRAYYELRKYDEALKMFEDFCRLYPKEPEGQEELKRTKRRVYELQTGDISFSKLRRKIAKNPTKEIDCADFKGPVEIVDVPRKGRGLVLSKDVKKDQILMVSKALAATLDPLKTAGMQLDPQKTLDTTRERVEIVAKIAQMISHNPKTFGPPVYQLSTGLKPPKKPVQLYCDPETEDEIICDVERIKAICMCNNFSIEYDDVNICVQGAGLFLLPSYMNHSCVPNVRRSFFNDVMVVQATGDLSAGEELTTNYVPATLPFEKRKERLVGRGFSCQCENCQKRI